MIYNIADIVEDNFTKIECRWSIRCNYCGYYNQCTALNKCSLSNYIANDHLF